jgi:hypothetical protein
MHSKHYTLLILEAITDKDIIKFIITEINRLIEKKNRIYFEFINTIIILFVIYFL